MSSIRRVAYTGYVLLSISFFIGFFHRFSPAGFSNEIALSLGLSITALGGLAAIHFWVYTLMQVPAGLMVDRFGIRLNSATGTFLTGVGSIVLSQADSYLAALIGPALVGVGMSAVFVGVMKYNSMAFNAHIYGLITGITMLIGTLGSFMSGAPSALLLGVFDWRSIFLWVGIITILLSILIFIFVSDYCDTHKVNSQNNGSIIENLLLILRSRQIIFLLLCTAGTNGTFYAFAGLWGAPILTDGFNLNSDNALVFISSSLLVYGVFSLFLGILSDFFKARKPFLIGASFIGVMAWILIIFYNWVPYFSGFIIYLMLGLSASQVVVAFSSVKESVPINNVGSSLAFVNMGVFLVSAIVQFLIGYLIDILEPSASLSVGYNLNTYKMALLVSLLFSVVGLVCSIKLKETYPSSRKASFGSSD
ncbi:hypothetical protein A8139_04885 [Marinomonas primoryensis]|mgnify:CR=1 FL=1|jgi:predicted MFS family arabinose efflux permease|uniref:Lysosomal dipeptide transporter MFSD1 n=1 Tax=Marinomonas primoryensis TaxID=178399 RepID=A0A2Z4PQT4_9GAMM|nr:MFS transporter [Marinomonas primoryensis]AWX99413.1 hypothetical protein A8139_04885 [Marinomonas primoryensis]|tara:strand:+ start:1705 stop:2967 length:1263 start_codon:yes stop_codon:yes gene_type:complete